MCSSEGGFVNLCRCHTPGGLFRVGGVFLSPRTRGVRGWEAGGASVRCVGKLSTFRKEGRATMALKGFSKLREKRRGLLGEVVGCTRGRSYSDTIYTFSVSESYLVAGRREETFLRSGMSCLVRVPFAGRLVRVRTRGFVRRVLRGGLRTTRVIIKASFGFNRRGENGRRVLRGCTTGCNCAISIIRGTCCGSQRVDDACVERLLLGKGIPLTGGLLKCPCRVADIIRRKRRLKEALKFPAVGLTPRRGGVLPGCNICTYHILISNM